MQYLILLAIGVLIWFVLAWLDTTKCPKCGSTNTFYEPGGYAGVWGIDEMFECYNCGHDKYN